MYKDFFGLKRSPFELSPDPYFVLPTAKIKDTLFSVYYAIAQRKGFVVLTGEVGTGKTLMVRCLLALLKRQQVRFCNVFNPRLSPLDFLRFVVHDLGIDVAESTKANLLQALYRFLLAQAEKGLTTVLVIDEAQQLPLSVLEEVRLLTNLETTQQKLLQIILVGQPELDAMLDSYELRQLKQRVAIRCRLQPLCESDVAVYVQRRLLLAGADGYPEIFPPETISAIFRYSFGLPRIINSLCDHGLLAAYARRSKVVSVDMINEIAAYLRLQPKPTLLAPERTRTNGNGGEQAAAKTLLQMLETLKKEAAGMAR